MDLSVYYLASLPHWPRCGLKAATKPDVIFHSVQSTSRHEVRDACRCERNLGNFEKPRRKASAEAMNRSNGSNSLSLAAVRM